MGEELLELARLRWHRVRLVAKESAHGILVALWLGLVGLIVTIVAAYYLVTGAAGALTELVGGHPWVGRLTIGAAGVGGGWLVLRLLRSRMRRLFVDSMNRTASEQAHPESESSHAA